MSMCRGVWSQRCSLIYLYIWTGVLLHSCGLMMLSIVKSCNTNSQKSCNMNTQKSCNANECSANFKQIAQIARKAPCHVFFLSTRKVLCSFFCFWNRHQISWNPSSLYSLHCKSCSLLSCCTVSYSQENFRILFTLSKQRKKEKNPEDKTFFPLWRSNPMPQNPSDCSSDFVKQTRT